MPPKLIAFSARPRPLSSVCSTTSWPSGSTPKGREDVKRGQCIDKPLMPAHIAQMALFLAADDSAMCTAQNFVVDGGWT